MSRRNEFLLSEVVVQRCSVKKVFLTISQNVHEKTCARVSFLIKLQALGCSFIKKETLAQVFSCEFCEIFKNNFFQRTRTVAASVLFRFDSHIVEITSYELCLKFLISAFVSVRQKFCWYET